MRERRTERVSLWTAWLVGLAQGEVAPELAREFELRAAAVAGERFESRAASPDWRERVLSLELVERSARAGLARAASDEALVRRGLADPHPSVRVRAWQAFAALGGGELTPQELARGVEEPLAHARLTVARALELARVPERAAAVLRLARDPDERVRRAARGVLAGLSADEPGRAAALEELLAAVAREEDEAAFARLLVALSVGGLDESELASARAAAQDDARAALTEASAFGALAAGEPEVLARGLARQRDEDWDPARARLVASAGRARSEALARALLSAIEARAPGGLARAAMLTLCVASLPRATAFGWLAANVADEELCAELVPELAAELERIDPEVAAGWLAAGRSATLREAVLGAAAAVFTRAREPGSEALLVRALAHAELAPRAFELLASAPALAPASEAALVALWGGFTTAERHEALGGFTRARAFPVFRADWLAFGEEEPAARAALGELLAPLGEDARAAECVRRWLAQDLAAVARADELERGLEQRVQSELRALARLAPESTEDFARALTVARGRTNEIGKLAAAGLGRSAAGLTELARRLEQGELADEADRRTRIEAGIQLARAWRGAARAPAVALLSAERENAAWDLRERMLEALALGAEEAPLALLGGLLLAPETEPVERTALVTLLATHQGESAAPVLLALLATRLDLEARRAAVAACGRWPSAAEGLAGWLTRVAGPGAEAADDETALLLGEARGALAAVAPTHPALREWWAGPLGRAADDLAARLAGRELSAVEFTWRQELEIARRLALAGVLASTLPPEGEWCRWDGRFLGELGRAAAEGEPALARRLTRAALLARLGERDPPRRELLALEARLCVLAVRAGDPAEAHQRLARLRAARRVGDLDDSAWGGLARALVPDEPDPDAALRAFALRIAPVRPAAR